MTEQNSHYLEFGGLAAARSIDIGGTVDYLNALGYGRGELRQARDAILSETAREFTAEGLSGRQCDFCFGPILGSDFEHLKDGRDRCSRCTRTAMKSSEQFVDEYQQVRRNMQLAFGIQLEVPMAVRMANAKEIERKTNEKFTATPGVDARVLGFVAKTSHGQELWIENGSPRMAAITTMAHELTHVWQNANWDEKSIRNRYGKKHELIVYEGMATWAMIQYLLFTREYDYAEWQHAYAMAREDAYGVGYQIFLQRYSLSFTGNVDEDSPFRNPMPL